MSDRDQNPLSRWSARKTQAREEAAREEAAREEAALAPEEKTAAENAAENAVVETTETEEKDQAATVAVEDLPDIDSLGKDSDYTVFMADGVPEPLKRMALRKLWLSDPLLANVDGLVDYGEDFTVAELMGDAVKTAYKVGKGIVDEVEELIDEEDESEAVEIAADEVDEPRGDNDDPVDEV